MVKNRMRPIHPGEILREEYMVPMGLSANALAHDLGVTPARINDIVREPAASRPIRRYVWRATSARMHNRGLTCKLHTICA